MFLQLYFGSISGRRRPRQRSGQEEPHPVPHPFTTHDAQRTEAPGGTPTMYCLQCLLPVLLIPKPTNPALMETHVMFIVLYLVGFFLERKPCTICSLVFLTAVSLICYSGIGNCIFWGNCEGHQCENG
ncbi:bladder cancer-associated protein isoform X1 [Drosophila serrata]|nr:bladder cancer-associated protein isoform X1 [Drosophila serrata]